MQLSKHQYTISKVDKNICKDILLRFHYLKDISGGFKSGFNYGLFKDKECVGVCIFTGFPVPELAKGMFGLERHEQDGLFELSRLFLEPTEQQKEHNLASWFVSRCVKILKKETNVRAILSYADNDFHAGIVYRACNFKYYGLTDKKCDFYIKSPDLFDDSRYVKHNRGKINGLDGEWRPRSQKHRYALIFDKSLNCQWREQYWKGAS